MKNILLGSDLTDERDRMFSDIHAGLNLILLNTGANTPITRIGDIFCFRSDVLQSMPSLPF